MPLPPSTDPFSIELRLHPRELLAAWQTGSRRLVLHLRVPLRLRQRVAARITIGSGVNATITGRVVSAGRQNGGFQVEVAPDEMRLPALERLLSIARGEPTQHQQPRLPRLLATIPAVVHGPAGPAYMTTFSLSENGCGLAWSGSSPAAVGSQLDIRFGAGSRTVVFRGVVCWTARFGSTNTVGVRFVAGARDAWSTMLHQARLSGAPPA
jgi:hypothetical protein